MSWEKVTGIFETRFGRLLMGIIKLALAGFLINLVGSLGNIGDIQVGGNTVPVGTIVAIIVAFFPIALLLSAMRDLGVSL